MISIIDSVDTTKILSNYFSEKALMSSSIFVEAKYLLALSQVHGIGFRKLTNNEKELIRSLHDISTEDYAIIKTIETKGFAGEKRGKSITFERTDHDVKAMEYFLRYQLTGTSLEDCFNCIHFGLTSEDINNLAVNKNIKLFLDEVFVAAIDKSLKTSIISSLISDENTQLVELRDKIANFQLTAKLMGATGTLAAHYFAFPKVDWLEFSKKFVESFGFKANYHVTQVEPKDSLARLFMLTALMNESLISNNRKANTYFRKANSLFYAFADKLPVSRLQRDLSDSTVQRNIGVAFSYTLLALKALRGEEFSYSKQSSTYDTISPLAGRYYKDVKDLEQFSDIISAVTAAYIPAIALVISHLDAKAKEYALLPMLARTHGQAATPTTIGKEYRVFVERLQAKIEELNKIIFPASSAGSSLKIAEIVHIIACINTIIKDLAVDFWIYIKDEWIMQKNTGTVGSSTMPHKINPIYFENAEGNVCVANALLYGIASYDESGWKEALGYSLLAAKSVLKGLEKTAVNETKISTALHEHPEVLAEAYQTELRKPEYKIADPYILMKQFTQGKQVTLQLLHAFVDSLSIPQAAKEKLKALTPEHYIGVAAVLAGR